MTLTNEPTLIGQEQKNMMKNKPTWDYGADYIEEHFFDGEPSICGQEHEISGPRLNWTVLVALEPQLSTLFDAAHRADSLRNEDGFCGHRFWQDKLKPPLMAVVGHWRPGNHPILSTSIAWDLAARHLYDAAPGCRDCQCDARDEI